MTASVLQGVDEPACGLDDVGISTERVDQGLHLLEVRKDFGVLFRQPEDFPPCFVLCGFELVSGAVFERLLTPHAELLTPGRLFFTSRTLNRGDRVGFVFADVHAVSACELAITGFSEDGDISSGDLASTSPSVMVFEDGLITATRGQKGRTRLSEVRERDGFGDVCMAGSLSRDLSRHLVRDFFSTPELAPERGGILIASWMIIQPSVEIRDRGNERDRTLPLLPVDSDLQAVFVVCDVADAEIEEFATPSTGVKGDGDQGRISAVHRLVDHRDDVFFPIEHFSRIRLRVVTPAGRRRNPGQAFRDAVIVDRDVDAVLDDALAEHPECDSVVFVRFGALLGIVLVVNPSDCCFCSRSVTEDVLEFGVGFLGDFDDVAEQLLTPLFAILARQERHPIVEREQEIDVRLADVPFPTVDLLPQSFELFVRVRYHVTTTHSNTRELNLGFIARLGRRNFGLDPSYLKNSAFEPSGCLVASATSANQQGVASA